MRTQLEGAGYEPGRGFSPEHDLASTLILDFQSLDRCLEKDVGMEGVDESSLLQDSKGGVLPDPFRVWSSGGREVWPSFPHSKLEPPPN